MLEAYLRVTNWFTDTLAKLARGEEGADAIEYLLTIAVVSVAIVLAISTNAWAPFVQAICTGVRGAIATLPGMGGAAGAC